MHGRTGNSALGGRIHKLKRERADNAVRRDSGIEHWLDGHLVIYYAGQVVRLTQAINKLARTAAKSW